MIDSLTARHLQELEQRLFQPEVRRSATELDRLLAEDFIEFGASGKIYDKRAIIDSLASEPPMRISLADFKAVMLAPEIVLVTYRALIESPPGAPPTHSLRSSIWVRQDGAWRMRFHQGTPTTSG